MADWYAGNSGSVVIGNDANNGTTAGTPKTMAGAIAAAASGDTIYYLPSATGYGQSNSSRMALNKSLTHKALTYGALDANPFGGNIGTHPGRFARTAFFDGFFQINGAYSCTIDGMGLRTTATPPAYDNPWSSVLFAGNQAPMWLLGGGANVVFTKCEPWVGDFTDGSYGPFDYTRRYDDMRSPATWYWKNGGGISPTYDGIAPVSGFPGWGDATYPRYNRIIDMPIFLSTSSGGATIVVDQCYLHDLGFGISASALGSGTSLTVQYSWFERIYQDNMQTPNYGYLWVSQRFHGNVYTGSFGNGYDGGNPHADLSQIFSGPVITPEIPAGAHIRGLQMTNCMEWPLPNQRAGIQGGFWGADRAVAVNFAPQIKRSMFIAINKLLEAGFGAQCFVDKCVAVTPDPLIALHGRGDVNVFDYDGAYSVPPNKSLLRDSVIDNVRSGTWARVNSTVRNAGTGGAIALSTLVTNPTATLSDANAAYNAFKPLDPTKGPGYATVRDMVLAPLTDYATEAVWIGIADINAVVPSTLTTSQPLAIRGGNPGANISITTVAGLEWRELDSDETTQLQGWSSASGTVHAGKCLQLRQTSAAGFSTPVTRAITLAGVAFSWTLRTKSNKDLPGASKPVSIPIRRTTDTGVLKRSGVALVDGVEGMAWLDFMIPAAGLAVNSTLGILYGTSNRTFRWTVNTNADASSYQITPFFSTTGGGSIGDARLTGLIPGKRYRIGATLKCDLADATQRLIWGGWNVTDNTPVSTASFGDPGISDVISWSFAHGGTFPQLFADTAVTIYGIFVDNRSMQGLGISPRPNWNYETSDLGPAGEALINVPATPLLNKPLIFLPGEVTLNNRGQAGAWVQNSGSLTAVNSETFPPQLSLLSEVITSGPYIAGQPIDFHLLPAGYAAAMNITPASDKAGNWSSSPLAYPGGQGDAFLTFTPTAAGTHTITFANDAGYIAPASIVLSVAAAPTTYSWVERISDSAGSTLDVPMSLTIDPA